MRSLLIFALALAQWFLPVGALSAKTSNKEAAEKAAIERVIRASIGWALNKDKDLLYGSVAQDADFFIFHPDSKSTITGFEAFRKLVEGFFMNDAFKATGFEVKDLRIHLAKSGKVAWYSALLDDFGEWQGKKTGWVDCRWTGVLEKRAKRWVIRQMHFSIATDKVSEKKPAQ